MKRINWKYLAIAVVSVVLVIIIGSMLTAPNTSSDWYESTKPSLTPPNWVFPIVWNILFLLIAISFYISLVNSKNVKERIKVYLAFYINFALNILWSLLYFELQNPLAAFIEVIFLWASIWFMIVITYRIKKAAGLLLIPYLLWVGFASILTFLSI